MNAFYCRRAGDLLGESSRVAPQQKRRAYALADAKPHFAPDRPCDIVHIALTLQLDIAQQSLRGTCATTVRAVQEAVPGLTLDAVDLQIAQVRQAGAPYHMTMTASVCALPSQNHCNAAHRRRSRSITVSRNRVWGSISSRQMPPTRTNQCRCGASVRTKTRATGSLALTHRTRRPRQK